MNTKNNTKKILITSMLIASFAASLMLIPVTNAHSPPWQIPTYAFISVSPNPIGAGQAVRINFWIDMPTPTASDWYGDRYQNLTVIVTEPNGNTATLGPFTADATGGTSTSFTPSTAGNYTFKMKYSGQILTNSNPAPSGPNAYTGDYMEPSTSNTFVLMVQQQPIPYAPVTPLPINYWTTPIYGENNNWYTIAGNWLGTGASAWASAGMYNSSTDYNPYTTAPNTAHILWTTTEGFGGIVGGSSGGSETGNYYSTPEYEPKFAPIIIQGILYYTVFPGPSSYPEGWNAINLKTGQVVWSKTEAETGNEVLRCGEILNMLNPNEYGGLAYLWGIPDGFMGTNSIAFGSPSYMTLYDAATGNAILNVTDLPSSPAPTVPAMTLTTDDMGGLIAYYINSTDNTLNMWNSTVAINLAAGFSVWGSGPNRGMWEPPQGAQIPFSLGIEWSVPMATTISGSPLFNPAIGLTGLGINGIYSNVVLMTESTAGMNIAYYTPGWQIEAGYSAVTGQQLWIVNRTETPYSHLSVTPGSFASEQWAGDGIYVQCSTATGSISGFSLTTGHQAWGPITLPNANPFDSLGEDAVVANNTIFIWGYGGDVYSYDITNGNLNWHYSTPSGGYESPYGVEPLWTFSTASVADGKLFLAEGHEYSPPLFHGAQQLALNTTNGQVVWSIDAFDVNSAPAIADGVMTTLNSYDNQIYAWGIGPTRTTVSAPSVGVTTSTPVTISGLVTDTSPGASQDAVAKNFPNGLPCVSDASMTQFMEAVYMQQPMPSNITGVPVTIMVTDSNHNTRAIGTTTTTNANGFYSLSWTPDIPGNFTVNAVFAGTQSYYGSSANAAFYASSPQVTASPTTSPVNGLATQSALEYIGIAIIVVIVIIGAVLAVLVTRKHP